MSLLLAALIAVSAVLGLSTAPVSAAPPARLVTNPCERLNAGEVQYPTNGVDRVTFATAKYCAWRHCTAALAVQSSILAL